jgi:molybdenum cofactor guanylyltransferase
MQFPCTGVILAGGLNTRFNGRSKALLKVSGRRIIEHLVDVFKALFPEIIVVTNHPWPYLQMDVMIVNDIFTVRSSLTGIHAGLFYACHPHAFFAACDTPFLQKDLVRLIVDSIRTGDDVVIPETEAGLEPLCAAYSKRCLKPVERQLQRNELKIQNFFRKVRLKKISADRLRDKDADLRSFFNINTPADLATAESMAGPVTPTAATENRDVQTARPCP